MHKFNKFLVALCSIFLLTGCSNFYVPSNGENTSDVIGQNNTTPVYKGMKLEKKGPNDTIRKQYSNKEDDNIDDKDDDDDIDDDDDKIDENENSDIFVDTGDTYYVSPNKNVVVNITIENPKQFEILSITLNDVKYQSYQFLRKSNSYNIYIEMTAPSNPGWSEFVISSIKYIDGVDTKEADLTKASKSIRFGVCYKNNVKATVCNEVISYDKYNCDLSFDNIDNIKVSSYVLNLYDENKNLIKKSTYEELNKIEFDGLSAHKNYSYSLEGVYDIFNGNGEQNHVILTKGFTTRDSFKIKDLVVGHNDISFKIETTSEEIKLNLVQIVDFDQVIDLTPTDEKTLEFKAENLLSNHDYILDVRDAKNNAISYNFKTLKYNTPILKFTSFETTANSISFKYNLEDIDKKATKVSFDLMDGDKIVKTTDKDNLKFDDLLSNHKYILKGTVEYDLKDGGVKSSSISKEICTLAYKVPAIKFNKIVSTGSSVKFDSEILDNDNLLTFVSYRIKKGSEVVKEITDKNQKEVAGLEENTVYTLEMNAKYDLKDGNGSHDISIKQDFITLLDSLKVQTVLPVSGNNVLIGSTIKIRVKFNEISGVDINDIYINDAKANIITTLGKNEYIITYQNDSYAAENKELKINKISYTSKGYTLEKIFSENNSVNICYHDILKIDSLTSVNDNYAVNLNTKQSLPIKINFYNPSHYKIISIDINGKTYSSDQLKFDSNYSNAIVSVPVRNTYNFSLIDFKVTNIEYETNGEYKATLNPLNEKYNLLNLNLPLDDIDQIKHIKTVEDFYSIQNNGIYVLDNDLDFSTEIFKSIDTLNNVYIDGNNHCLKNILADIQNLSSSEGIGLINNLENGVITNLTIKDSNFYLDASVNTRFGTFVSRAYDSVIDNCNLISSNINNINGDASGILNYGDSTIYTNCHVDRSNIKGKNKASGHVLGTRYISNCSVTNSTIDGYDRSAGICDDIAGYGVILDCYSASNIFKGGNYCGSGIIGYINSDSFLLSNCITINNKHLDHYNANYFGRIVGVSLCGFSNCISINCDTTYSSDDNKGSNCIYSNIDTENNENNNLNQIKLLNDKNNYIYGMNFSENIWNLNNLDVLNGVYPTLKY